jgi:hypothetical protein
MAEALQELEDLSNRSYPTPINDDRDFITDPSTIKIHELQLLSIMKYNYMNLSIFLNP